MPTFVPGLKRVVFAVQVPEDMRGENVVFADACSQMASAGVKYTIVKYAETHHIKEARFPYRIVRDVLPIPGPTTPADPRLSSGPVLADSDLRRVSDLRLTFGFGSSLIALITNSLKLFSGTF